MFYMTLDDQIRPSSITQAQRKFKRAKPTFTLIGRDFTTVQLVSKIFPRNYNNDKKGTTRTAKQIAVKNARMIMG